MVLLFTIWMNNILIWSDTSPLPLKNVLVRNIPCLTGLCGDGQVIIKFASKEIPKSPFKISVEGAAGDATKVTAKGPGIEKTGVVATKKTYFEVYTRGEMTLSSTVNTPSVLQWTHPQFYSIHTLSSTVNTPSVLQWTHPQFYSEHTLSSTVNTPSFIFWHQIKFFLVVCMSDTDITWQIHDNCEQTSEKKKEQKRG